MTQSRNADKFVCRLPDGMREQLAEVAKANRRSMNSELVYRLESSLAGATKEAHALALCVEALDQLVPFLGKVPADVGLINNALMAARPLLPKA